MIDRKQLREGSKIKANGLNKGRVLTVQYLRYYKGQKRWIIYFEDSDKGEYPEDCEGVPLTPELLDACGFIKNEENLFILHLSSDNYTDSIHIHKDSGWWYAIDKLLTNDDYGSLNREIKHLHQLQNLHLLLTGKEIEYTPVTEKA